MAKTSPRTAQNYAKVMGNPQTGPKGGGTPITRTSTGADFTHSVKRTPQTGHSNGRPSPSGNW